MSLTFSGGLKGTLAARRRAAGVIHGDENLHKVFSELAFRYKSVP